MSYPFTVDTGQVAPALLIADGALSSGAGAAVVAGAAYLSEYTLLASVTVAQMRTVFSGSPTGNVDMGIYDSSGTNGAPSALLGHTGAIVAATGLYTQNLTANLPLSPGKYWLAFLDTVADSVWSRGVGAAGVAAVMRTSATNLTVLPSTLGTLINSNNIIELAALLSGSYS